MFDGHTDNSGTVDWKQYDVNSAGILAAGFPIAIAVGLFYAVIVFAISFCVCTLAKIIFYTIWLPIRCAIWLAKQNIVALRRCPPGKAMRSLLVSQIVRFVGRDLWTRCIWGDLFVGYYYNDILLPFVRLFAPAAAIAEYFTALCVQVYLRTMAVGRFAARFMASTPATATSNSNGRPSSRA